MGEQCKLTVVRESGKAPLAIYGAELDGMMFGKLKTYSELSVSTSPGRHELVFTQFGKVKKSVCINIPEGETEAKVFVDINIFSGKLELRLQNAEAVINGSTPVLGNDAVKVNVKQTNYGCDAGCLPAIIIVLVISFIISFLPSDDSKSDVDSSKYEDMSDKEAAAAMLKDAGKEFGNNDYQSAFKLCEEIINKYPDSAEAANMVNYKNEQLAVYLHISADELMGEYEANIVNADDKYTDKVVVISGTVSSIGKTNGDSNLVVLLNSNTFLACVQLNFNKDSTKAVADLREGSKITAIGNCTGKSGKQFIVFDGLNVMVEDCILLN